MDRNDDEWIVIVYKLPSLPSRSRVSVWRKLKKAGAIYYQQGVAMLPRSSHFVEFMKSLKAIIESYGGDAVLANFSFLDAADSRCAIDRFNSGLTKEYSGIKQTGERIFGEIEKSRQENLLDPGYLEQRIIMLDRLKKAYEKIKARDYFKVQLREKIDEHIDNLIEKVKLYYKEIKKSARPAE